MLKWKKFTSMHHKEIKSTNRLQCPKIKLLSNLKGNFIEFLKLLLNDGFIQYKDYRIDKS